MIMFIYFTSLNSTEQKSFFRSKQLLSKSRNTCTLWNPKDDHRIYKSPLL